MSILTGCDGFSTWDRTNCPEAQVKTFQTMSMNFMPVNVFATNYFFESLQCHWFTYWGMDKTGLAFCMHTMHVIVHTGSSEGTEVLLLSFSN